MDSDLALFMDAALEDLSALDDCAIQHAADELRRSDTPAAAKHDALVSGTPAGKNVGK
jgi:hypothetical protein